MSAPFPPGRTGIGGAALGNLFAPMTDECAQGVLDAAWDAGIRYVDTAPHYGLGLSERRIGRWLAGRPREEVVLSTKVGRRLVPVPGATGDDLATGGFAVPADHERVWDTTPDGVRRTLEDSLARLGTDRVDLLYLHDVDESPDPDRALREGLDSLAGLRAEGVVDRIGVGSKSVATLTAAARSGLCDALMVAGRLTLLEWADDLARACVETGTAIVVAGVFNSGLLARPEPGPDSRYEYGEVPPAQLERARELAHRARDAGSDLPTAALHFPLRHEAVSTVVIGASSPEQVRVNAGRLAAPVPAGLWDALVPVPR